MWINRQTFDDLHKQLYITHGRNQTLEHNYTALMTTLDWLRVRVTQLEMERAQMLYNYTGVKVPTPIIDRKPEALGSEEWRGASALPPRKQAQGPEGAVAGLPNFEDVGDAEAARLGIDWNPDGTLRYGVPSGTLPYHVPDGVPHTTDPLYALKQN